MRNQYSCVSILGMLVTILTFHHSAIAGKNGVSVRVRDKMGQEVNLVLSHKVVDAIKSGQTYKNLAESSNPEGVKAEENLIRQVVKNIVAEDLRGLVAALSNELAVLGKPIPTRVFGGGIENTLRPLRAAEYLLIPELADAALESLNKKLFDDKRNENFENKERFELYLKQVNLRTNISRGIIQKLKVPERLDAILKRFHPSYLDQLSLFELQAANYIVNHPNRVGAPEAEYLITYFRGHNVRLAKIWDLILAAKQKNPDEAERCRREKEDKQKQQHAAFEACEAYQMLFGIEPAVNNVLRTVELEENRESSEPAVSTKKREERPDQNHPSDGDDPVKKIRRNPEQDF